MGKELSRDEGYQAARTTGDVAFVSGHSMIVPADGGTPVVVGRYIDIRVKQPDETWLFYRDVVTPAVLHYIACILARVLIGRKGDAGLGADAGVWVQGSRAGKWVKKSLNTRDWSIAAATLHEWEAARQIGGKPFVVPTISEALQKYFDDAEARHLAPSTIRKRRELLNGKLVPYCTSKGMSS